MATLMPIAAALLTAFSVHGVLSFAGSCEEEVGSSAYGGGGFFRGASGVVESALSRLGAVIPTGARTTPLVRRCCEELCRMRAFERLSCMRPRAGAYSGEMTAMAFRGALRSVSEREAGVLVVAIFAGGLVGYVAAGSVLGWFGGAVLVVILLLTRSSKRLKQERRRVEAAMPEAFSALAVALGSGHTLAQGMRFVGGHAEEPIRSEFLRVACAIECGVPASDALDDLLERLPAPGLGLVSLALKISQRTGAPLRGLLAEAADMVNERLTLARRLDVKTSQARMSARLVAWMPVAMVCALALVSVDFRKGLATPVGTGSVAVALVLDACAWLIIQRIMKVRVG